MYYDNLFIESKLPEPLTETEIYYYFEKYKFGDTSARDTIINCNIKLVLNEVLKKFDNTLYEKSELISIGLIGLIKSVDTFDTSKKFKFSTYAIRCIDNEILSFLMKQKKYANDDSLDRTIKYYKDGNELKLEDTLSDNIDIVEEYTDKETHCIIREVVKKLPDRDRKIVMLYFGFYNYETHTQKEIADMLSVSQPYISGLITKIVKQVGKILEEKGLIELRRTTKRKHTFNSKNKTEEGGKKKSRKLQTI